MVKEIAPDKVFKGYSEGKHYTAVDFEKKKYIDCDKIMVGELAELVSRPASVKFYREDITGEE